MPNLANINVTISATDNTGPGVSSAKSNLASLGGSFGSLGSIASGVFGGILGFATFRAITGGISSVVSSALNLNSRMAQSAMAAKSMVNAIAEAEPTGTGAFGAMSKAAEQFERTMREIRERESDGLADYATKIDDIKNKILEAEQEVSEKKDEIYAKEKRQIDDLNESHLESIEDLNDRLISENAAFEERIYDLNNSRQDKLDNLDESHAKKVKDLNEDLIDAEEELLTASTAFDAQRAQARIDSLNDQLSEENSAYDAEKIKINERADHEIQVVTDKHERELAILQRRIDRENAEYDKRKTRIEQDTKDDIAQAEEASSKKIATLEKQLANEEEQHRRFLRDIEEAYADAASKMEESMSGGGGGGSTMRRIKFQFDFAQNLKDMGTDEINKFLDDVQKKYIEIGIKSPFNIGDIQEFGKTMIRYTDGSADNMQKVLEIGQALAAYNPMQGIQGATFALNELLGQGNVRSLMTRFNLPADAFKGLENAKDASEALNLLDKNLGNLGITMELVDAYANSLAGAHENVMETFSVLAAYLMKPIYDVLTEGLVNVNKFLGEHMDQIRAVADVIATFVSGAAGTLVDWAIRIGQAFQEFWSQHGAQVTEWFTTFTDQVSTNVVPIIEMLTAIWSSAQTVLEETIIPSLGRIFNKISELWTAVAPEFKKTVEWIKDMWDKNHKGIETIAKVIWNTIEFVISTALDFLKAAIKFWLAVVRGDWEGAWNAIAGFFKDIWNNLKTFVKNIWDSIGEQVKNGINGVIDKINGFINNINSALRGKSIGPISLDVSIPTIPKLAAGGVVTSPTLAMIGEAGPEAVVPLSRSKGTGFGGNEIYISVTGNNILDDEMSNTLADNVGQAIVDKLALQGRIL